MNTDKVQKTVNKSNSFDVREVIFKHSNGTILKLKGKTAQKFIDAYTNFQQIENLPSIYLMNSNEVIFKHSNGTILKLKGKTAQKFIDVYVIETDKMEVLPVIEVIYFE